MDDQDLGFRRGAERERRNGEGHGKRAQKCPQNRPFHVVKIVSASLAVPEGLCHPRPGEAAPRLSRLRARRSGHRRRGRAVAQRARPADGGTAAREALPARRPALARERHGALPDALASRPLERVAGRRPGRRRSSGPRHRGSARLANRSAVLDRRLGRDPVPNCRPRHTCAGVLRSPSPSVRAGSAATGRRSSRARSGAPTRASAVRRRATPTTGPTRI